MPDDRLRTLVETRARRPEAIAEAAAARRRPSSPLGGAGRVLVVAADHPARVARRRAAADGDGAPRRPAGPDVRRPVAPRRQRGARHAGHHRDLLLLGALDGKAVFGSMNRGGLAGAAFEIDDRFTAYDAAALDAMGYEGGKMLLRVDLDDPATAPTVEACGHAVSELAERRLVAMVEPFMSRRRDGRARVDPSADATILASVIAAGLGNTSAYTWLKIPVVEDMQRVCAATTLPLVLLGGEVREDQDAVFASWSRALANHTVVGLVVGRSLLYPPDDDVAATVDAAAGLLAAPVGR